MYEFRQMVRRRTEKSGAGADPVARMLRWNREREIMGRWTCKVRK
jgi:hypothetical protein